MCTQGLARTHVEACDSKSCACERVRAASGPVACSADGGTDGPWQGEEFALLRLGGAQTRPHFNLTVPPQGEIEERKR